MSRTENDEFPSRKGRRRRFMAWNFLASHVFTLERLEILIIHVS